MRTVCHTNSACQNVTYILCLDLIKLKKKRKTTESAESKETTKSTLSTESTESTENTESTDSKEGTESMESTAYPWNHFGIILRHLWDTIGIVLDTFETLLKYY